MPATAHSCASRGVRPTGGPSTGTASAGPPDRGFLDHSDTRARQAPGARPVCRRNTSPKWLCEAKPVA